MQLRSASWVWHVLVLLCLGWGVAPGCLVAAEPRYNVLFIIADDLRCALGCYGDAQAKTPHLDRLARRGLLFERAYVQYPVCNPSRTSLLTSTRPEKNGVTGNATFFRARLPDVVTLPQLYRQQGGQAVSYGKILHTGLVEGEIEHEMLDLGRSWDEARMFHPTALGSNGPVRNLTGGTLKWCRVGAMDGGDDDQSDGQAAQHVIGAMERFGRKRWFIGAGFHRPHDPFLVSRKYVEWFPAGSLKLHRDPAHASPLVPLAIGGRGFLLPFERFTDRDQMDYLTHYYAGVSQTDAQIGRLMAALDRLQLWDQTVVVFVGDHGFHLGERGWWNKNTLFERSCRAPCILVAPGVKPGVCRSLVELMDIYPTVADLCELKKPAHVEGKSWKALLQDPKGKLHDGARTYLQREAGVEGRSIRTERWRFTEWTDGATELYDHETDPEEWRNLIGQSDLASTVKELRSMLNKSKAL